MKRFFALMAAGIVGLTCVACGCTNSEPATIPSTVVTIPTTMPVITLPPVETNIPDPDIDPYADEYEDTTEQTERVPNGMIRSGRNKAK